MTAETSLKLLSRPGCHLCDVAAATLTSMGVAFVTVDVDTDGDLQHRYSDMVPVLLYGDEAIAAAPITDVSLRAALEGAGISLGRARSVR